MSLRTLSGSCLVVAMLAACGGAPPPATQPSSSAAPGTGPVVQPSAAAPPVAGEPITSEDVAAAVGALQAHESWTFSGRYWIGSLGQGVESTVTGTQRTAPQNAIDAQHPSADGAVLRYIRIGDDIWTDVGTGEFFQSDAGAAENLIDQYEPYYIAALVTSVDRSDVEFELVGEETVNGVATTHYSLPLSEREHIVQTLEMDPADWAGDVWLANSDGSLIALAWGPQTVETAGPLLGFRYDVTELDCACPIEPPQ